MEEFHDRFMKTQPATWEQVLVEFQNQRQRRRKQRWESHIPPPPEENICSDDHIAMVHFISPTSNTAALKCFLGTAAVERLTPSTAAAGFRSKEERSNASRLSNLIRFGGEFVRIVPITYRQFLEQEEDTEEHSHAPDEGQNQEDQQQPNNRGGQEQQEPTNQEQNQEHEEDIAIVYESRGSPKNRIRRIKEIIAKDDVHSEEEEELETFFKCGICFCHPPSASQVVCCTSGHIYCSDCLHGWAAAQVPSPTTCPECRVSMAGEGGIVRLRVIEEFLKKMHVSKEQRKKQVRANNLAKTFMHIHRHFHFAGSGRQKVPGGTQFALEEDISRAEKVIVVYCRRKSMLLMVRAE